MEGYPSLSRFKFERTPTMSTYLLAFVIGEYDYIEEKDRNGVLIRVYTPLGKIELGRFALEVSFPYNISELGSKDGQNKSFMNRKNNKY